MHLLTVEAATLLTVNDFAELLLDGSLRETLGSVPHASNACDAVQAELDVDDVLKDFQKKFNLSEAHLEYIRKDVEDACDLDDEQASEEIKKIEGDLNKMVRTALAALNPQASCWNVRDCRTTCW